MRIDAIKGPLGMWLAGLWTGASTLRREPLLGLKRLALPVSYWRAAEFAYAMRQLSLPPGARVLDLGSPKDLAIFLARDRSFEVVATDILPEAVDLSHRSAMAQGLAGVGPGRVCSEIADGRALPYSDGSFDAAFSVSVLEHIPDRGDSLALAELVRVVRPGGVIVVTTPFALRHRDAYVEHDVYERQRTGNEPVFYERHYDAGTLEERLLGTPGTRLVDLQHWGEPYLRIERLLRTIGQARTLLSPFEAFLAAAALRAVAADDEASMAAFFTLQKL